MKYYLYTIQKNSTLDGSLNMLVNSAGGVEGKKTWGVYGESEVLP